jgi:hypothetical protein
VCLFIYFGIAGKRSRRGKKETVGEVRSFCPPKNISNKNMIIEYDVPIKEILKYGKKFKWKKPSVCPCCGDSVLWGHGTVLCFFMHIASGLYLKRYRCNSCKCVIKLKPAGFFKGFQTPVNTIRQCIRDRLDKRESTPEVPRQNQDYWLRNLRINIRAILGEEFKTRIIDGFEQLLKLGGIPVSCSFHIP